MPDPQYHFQWWHSLFLFLGLSPLAAFKKVRALIWGVIKLKAKEEVERRHDVVTSKEFETFKADNTREHDSLKDEFHAHHDELGRIIHASAMDISDTAKEIRETLRLFDLKYDQKNGEIHDRITKNEVDIASVKGRLDGMREAG